MTPFKASSSFLPPLEKIIHTPYLGLHDLAPACLSSLALPILLLIAILLPSWPITCIFASGPLCLPLLPSAENTVSPELPWLPLSLHSGVCTNISILDRLSLTLYLIQDTHAFPICTHSLYPIILLLFTIPITIDILFVYSFVSIIIHPCPTKSTQIVLLTSVSPMSRTVPGTSWA